VSRGKHLIYGPINSEADGGVDTGQGSPAQVGYARLEDLGIDGQKNGPESRTAFF